MTCSESEAVIYRVAGVVNGKGLSVGEFLAVLVFGFITRNSKIPRIPKAFHGKSLLYLSSFSWGMVHYPAFVSLLLHAAKRSCRAVASLNSLTLRNLTAKPSYSFVR